MSSVQSLLQRWERVRQAAHDLYWRGDAEECDDLMTTMESIEKVELPRARAQTRAEQRAAAAARRAPDYQPARLPDGALVGWTDDPLHRRALPQSVVERVDAAEKREAALAEQAEQAEAFAPLAQYARWQQQVLAGEVPAYPVPDFDEQPAPVEDVPAEELVGAIAQHRADHLEVQHRLDRQMELASSKMGQLALEVLGVDGLPALRRLLDVDDSGPGSGPGRTREGVGLMSNDPAYGAFRDEAAREVAKAQAVTAAQQAAAKRFLEGLSGQVRVGEPDD